MEKARHTVRSGNVDANAVSTIREITRLAQADECAGVFDPDAARSIVLHALENATAQGNRKVIRNLYIVLAEVEIARRSLDGAMNSLENALHLAPDFGLIETGVSILNSAGLFREALVFIDSQSEPPNTNVVLRAVTRSNWFTRMAQLREKQIVLIREETSQDDSGLIRASP